MCVNHLEERVFASRCLHFLSDRFDDVDLVAKEAMTSNPDEASLYYNYANTLGKADKYEASEKNFLKAIQLQPRVASYYANLGESFLTIIIFCIGWTCKSNML